MYSVSWFGEKGLFCAQGASSANSLFFEHKDHHQLFFKKWHKYMGGMTQLVHYSFTSTSWVVVFETKSKEEIINAYKRIREKSKKAKASFVLDDIGRIISEHMRITLSQFARKRNLSTGRAGTVVKHRFRKFAFFSNEDYKHKISEMEEMQKVYEQLLDRYRADESRYDENREIEFAGLGNFRFVSTKPYYTGLNERHFCVDGFVRLGENLDVLRKKISDTQLRHFPPKNPPPSG